MEGRAHNLPHVLRLLTGMVVLGALMGLLLAGLAIPAIGAGGTATKSGVKAFNDLPSEFSVSPLAQQSRILDASGKLIANPYDENRIIVPLKSISPWMQKAQIAIEDSRFYEHGGLDVRGFTRAMVSNFQSGDVQGASTLTQQYVKITLQENALRADDKEAARAAVAKTYTRKLQELKYALDVERNYTKEQILTGYLNLVYYGDLAYGVEAAAQNYFGVPASKLTLGQSALMAGIVQQPDAFNPVKNPKDSQARRNVVLDRMAFLGLAPAADVTAAKKVPVKDMLSNRKPPKGVCQRSSEPFFCSYMMAYLERSPQLAVLGKTPNERLKNINQGGLTIKTTLDPTLQKATLRELTKAVPIGNKSNLGAASTVLEPGTGKVLAMAQAADFSQTQVNLNVDQRYGGGPYGYQFGSTAKTYALVTALESGMPLDGTINAPSASPDDPHTFYNNEMKDKCGTGSQGWQVGNDYRSGGRMSLAKATTESINTAFAQLTIDLGACKVRDTMTRMGLHRSDGEQIETDIPAIALGAGTVTPMTIAASYATLAARGKYCEPTPIASITTSDNKPVKIPATACKQVIKPDIADGVNQLLEGPLRDSRGTARGSWNESRPAAGKTGTTNKHNQSWFVGYTPQRVASVWVGNIKVSNASGRFTTLNHKCFGSYGCRASVFGGTIAGPVWGNIMEAATDGLPVVQFTSPSESVRNGNYIRVPDVSGNSISTATNKLENAGFSVNVGSRVDSSIDSGRVAYTSPDSRAMKGSTVTLLISSGYTPPVVRRTTRTEAPPTPKATPDAKPTVKTPDKPTRPTKPTRPSKPTDPPKPRD